MYSNSSPRASVVILHRKKRKKEKNDNDKKKTKISYFQNIMDNVLRVCDNMGKNHTLNQVNFLIVSSYQNYTLIRIILVICIRISI